MLVSNWLTNSLTKCRLVNLIDVTLAYEDANSKLVEVVTVANVGDEDRVGNSLLHTWELRLGNKAKLLFRLWAQGFEVEVQARIEAGGTTLVGMDWGWGILIKALRPAKSCLKVPVWQRDILLNIKN